MVTAYVKEAKEHLEKATESLDLFCKKAEPKTTDAQDNLNAIEDFSDRLQTLRDDYSWVFEEILSV